MSLNENSHELITDSQDINDEYLYIITKTEFLHESKIKKVTITGEKEGQIDLIVSSKIRSFFMFIAQLIQSFKFSNKGD